MKDLPKARIWMIDNIMLSRPQTPLVDARKTTIFERSLHVFPDFQKPEVPCICVITSCLLYTITQNLDNSIHIHNIDTASVTVVEVELMPTI